MGLENGIPKGMLLRWAELWMTNDPAFSDVRYDEALERVFFTARHRRYKLTIQRGVPLVEQVEGPAETTFP